MNYRHAYHAGHFADVFKHTLLIMLIDALLKKDTGFCYLDSHSGIGMYDLFSREAQKTKEYQTGIARVYNAAEKPKIIRKYLKIVEAANDNSKQLRFYPGSPCIVQALLRPQDKMILTELHSADALTLKQRFQQNKQVSVHTLDGYQALKAFLPPTLRRGLVLIDPPYEELNEFDSIINALKVALDRWSTGIYAIWYPVKSRQAIYQFERKLKKLAAKEILITELNLYPDDSPLALNGSGLAIINPPWQFANALTPVLHWLLTALDSTHKGSYRIEKILA